MSPHSSSSPSPDETARLVAEAVDAGRLEREPALRLAGALQDPGVREAVMEGAFESKRRGKGDRISVSFIGILTSVTYQLVMWDVLPHISYFTLMHGFLQLSFVTMGATVVINLVVGELDKAGRQAAGDRLDRRCRWIFPLVYFGGVGALFGFARVFF